MTERRPSHSPADDDSDFLWQSTCGSDISPCLAEPDPHPSRRDSDHPRNSLDVDDSQRLDSFGLDSVELPSSTSEAHAIVGRRARWRGSEIYSEPASSGEPALDGATSPDAGATAAPAAAPIIPPLVPLVATMLAAALAFVVMMAVPGRFGSPPVAPASPGTSLGAPSDPVAAEPASPATPAANPPPPSQPEMPPSDVAPPAAKPAPEQPAIPPSTPIPVVPVDKPAVEPTMPPVVGALPLNPAPPAKPLEPVAPSKPAVAAEKPPAIPIEVSRLAGPLAEQRLSIARQLEVAGRYEAAMKRLQTLAEEFRNTNVGDEAAARLKNLQDAMK